MKRVTESAAREAGARTLRPLSSWFRERELFLRGDGNLKYLHLTRGRQMAIVGVGVGFSLWLVIATVGLAYLGADWIGKTRQLEAQRLTYLDLLSEVGEYHEQFAKIIGDLEGNQSMLLARLAEEQDAGRIRSELKDTEVGQARMMVQRQALKHHLEGLESELRQLAARDADRRTQLAATLRTLEQTRAEGAKVADARERLDRELDRVEQQLADVRTEKSALEAELASARQALKEARRNNDTLASEKAAFHAELQSLYRAIATAPRREAKLRERIAALEDSLKAANLRADMLRGQRDFQRTRAGKLEERLDEVSEIQTAVVQRLTKRTLSGIDMIERVVAMTGVDVDDLIGFTDTDTLGLAQGGPYIARDRDSGADNPHRRFQYSVALLDQQIARWEALQEVVRSIPLTSPLDSYEMTSGFGERSDPLNGRHAVHYGVDLKAAMRTPVLAPAPGKVVFAGWKGHYGRLVEIDHGNGFRTRYAHLRKILVKQGQMVSHREEIGLLGSSGRSTGPHLHYEVEVNGQVYDPNRFMMAGRNAFKS